LWALFPLAAPDHTTDNDFPVFDATGLLRERRNFFCSFVLKNVSLPAGYYWGKFVGSVL
jgi:hypothetical protein